MIDTRHYLITGAGRDIGRAMALKLAGPGRFAILHYSASARGAKRRCAPIAVWVTMG